MVFPEFSLVVCRQGGLGSRLRQLVVPEGEVLKNQFDLPGVFLEHLLEDGDKPRAVWSLEIIEDGDGHRCTGRPFKGRTCVIELVEQTEGENLKLSFATSPQDEPVACGAVLDGVEPFAHLQSLDQNSRSSVYGHLAGACEYECVLAVARHGDVKC